MSVWPAIVSVPLRAAPVFAVTVYVTAPFPEPDAPRVIATHDTFDVAVQAQPPSASTATVFDPPSDDTV